MFILEIKRVVRLGEMADQHRLRVNEILFVRILLLGSNMRCALC